MHKPQKRILLGWLTAIFLLCAFQGWLLSTTNVMAAIVFGFWIVNTGWAVSKSQEKIVNTSLIAIWGAMIAWVITGVVAAVLVRAVSWRAVLAVAVSMLIATVIIWAWCLAIATLGKELLRSFSPKQTFLILVLVSYAGFGFGLLTH